MAKYGSDILKIEWNASDISDFIDEINGANIEAMLQETHAFGDSWVENLATGLKRMENIELGGFYDDVGGGPDAIFVLIGTSQELIITYGATKKTTVTCIIAEYKRLPSRGELHRFSVTLVPTGSVVEA